MTWAWLFPDLVGLFELLDLFEKGNVIPILISGVLLRHPAILLRFSNPFHPMNLFLNCTMHKEFADYLNRLQVQDILILA